MNPSGSWRTAATTVARWERLRRRGIDLTVPHPSTRKRRWPGGRKLRRYPHRWIIERTNAWLHNVRRLVVRYERRADVYLAFVHVACMLIATPVLKPLLEPLSLAAPRR